MKIQEEDPGIIDVHTLLLEHLADMRKHSPPESVHALDLAALRTPAITFWTVRDNNVLQGCGALKQLNNKSAEIKSMKTATRHQRKGIANLLLSHMVAVAKKRDLSSLSLETGTPDAFIPARQLYASFGFVECPPFGDYGHDPYSVFMRLDIEM